MTEAERLSERISHERFTALLADERTAVHHMEVSSTADGEFLFITMSQSIGPERRFLSFWSLGYHQAQERWQIDEWNWSETVPFRHQLPQKVEPADARAWIQARIDEITPHMTPAIPSTSAQQSALLARSTDEDNPRADADDVTSRH